MLQPVFDYDNMFSMKRYGKPLFCAFNFKHHKLFKLFHNAESMHADIYAVPVNVNPPLNV